MNIAVNLREEIEVVASGLTRIYKPGAKCVHGVYIPKSYDDDGTSVAPQHYSSDCTVCRSLDGLNPTQIAESQLRIKSLWSTIEKEDEDEDLHDTTVLPGN